MRGTGQDVEHVVSGDGQTVLTVDTRPAAGLLDSLGRQCEGIEWPWSPDTPWTEPPRPFNWRAVPGWVI